MHFYQSNRTGNLCGADKGDLTTTSNKGKVTCEMCLSVLAFDEDKHKRAQKSRIALICGVAPMCDRCGENDAKVQIDLTSYGQRVLCEECVVEIVDLGFESVSESYADFRRAESLARD